ASPGDVLRGDIRFSAVSGDANTLDAEFFGTLQVFDAAYTRQDERGEHGVLHRGCCSLDPLPIGVRAETVGGARTTEAVAVGDLDRTHASSIQRGNNCADLLGRVLVTHGVHSVAQGHILNVNFGAHAATHPRVVAIFSAACRAAEVIMSR